MFVSPGDFAHRISREAAQRVASNWWMFLLNGLLLIVAGVLIFSIDWSLRSLATFIGALFILEGVTTALTAGIDQRVRRVNVITGLLSMAVGVAIIVWPAPGIVAVAIFLGSWLIVMGTITIAGAFAARNVFPNWWLLLILGLLEVPLGVLSCGDLRLDVGKPAPQDRSAQVRHHSVDRLRAGLGQIGQQPRRSDANRF